MSSSNEFLTSPSPSPLLSANNSFVSNWLDKRSSNSCGISVVFYGTNAPDGYAWLEVSNAPFATGTSYGQPANSGNDATELLNSQQTITLNPITNLYTAQWLVNDCPSHYIRLRYTSQGNVSGLSVDVYGSVPYTSQ